MKKLLVAFGLCATLFSSLSVAARPASAAVPQLPPLNIISNLPEPTGLQLRPIAPLDLKLILLPKAELTSQLFVVPTSYPGVKRIYCYVKNSGLKDSGWFRTVIRIHRPFLPTIQAYVWLSIPKGQHRWIVGDVYVPTGIQRVFSYADDSNVVLEYNEFNNWDSIP